MFDKMLDEQLAGGPGQNTTRFIGYVRPEHLKAAGQSISRLAPGAWQKAPLGEGQVINLARSFPSTVTFAVYPAGTLRKVLVNGLHPETVGKALAPVLVGASVGEDADTIAASLADIIA